MQVILRNDVSECEEVLKALEEDPEKETKLKEMNEEGLTLIHCAVMCDKHCAVRCDRHDTSEECTKLLWLKRLLKMGAGRLSLMNYSLKILPKHVLIFMLSL